MELIAALLHSPQVLFLDEPTIGLDVVAQHNIQQFLRHYQEQRGTTILLTSHYMKDVAALCRRVVIIAQGAIHYDGSLSGIVDRFSTYKRVTLLFRRGTLPDDLEQYGRVLSRPPQGDVGDRAAVRGPLPGGDSGSACDRGRERRRSAAGRSDRRHVLAKWNSVKRWAAK